MRRIMLVVTVALVMALMLALSGVASASHVNDPPCTEEFVQDGIIYCVQVVEETVPAERPCEVGRSGRMGTQEGTITTTTTYSTHRLEYYHTLVGGYTEVEEGPFVATGPCRTIPGPQ
jgi:hypothetical protein